MNRPPKGPRQHLGRRPLGGPGAAVLVPMLDMVLIWVSFFRATLSEWF